MTYDKASIKGEFEATKHEWKLTKFQHFQEYLRNTSRSIYLGNLTFSHSEFHSLKCSVSAIMMRRLLTLGFGCIRQVFLGFNAGNLIGYRHVQRLFGKEHVVNSNWKLVEVVWFFILPRFKMETSILFHAWSMLKETLNSWKL